MNKLRYIFSLLGVAGMLGACSGTDVKDTLGLGREAPDEFRVVARPPLAVPPVFKLRPPASAAEVPTNDARNSARKIVTGEEGQSSAAVTDPSMAAETAVIGVSTSELSSTAESQLLSKAGTQQKKENIRELIQQEVAVQEPEEEPGLLDKLQPKKGEQPTVDAKKERERIEANKKENKPVNAGETPVLKPKDKGVLGKIF